MASLELGRNRLATGFVRPQKMGQAGRNTDTVPDNSRSINSHGEAAMSSIEISDDDMEGSEGGMLINLDQDMPSDHVVSPDNASSQEPGELTSDSANNSLPQDNLSASFVIDTTPSHPGKRLIDLNSKELDDQLKYAFYHLDRDQIDLSRQVICLRCTGAGHLQYDCTESEAKTFANLHSEAAAQLRLWISCCICASKSHLVGDCPELGDIPASRWSLKSLDPQRIINMSLETGTKRLEKEAQNRNMRPEGLQIKGRAGIHHAGFPQPASSSDDEPFLRQSVRRQKTDNHVQSLHSPHHDRYDTSSNRQSYRGGGQWYATDSFGRRRSRSPGPGWNSYRPRGEYDRSRVSPQRDDRGPPPRRRNEQYRAGNTSVSDGSRGPSMSFNNNSSNTSSTNVHFSLPTRKGSNTWPSAARGGSDAILDSDKSKPSHQPKNKNKNKNKNKKKA